MTQTDPLAEQARQSRTSSAGWMIQRLGRGLSETMKARLATQGLTLDQTILLLSLAEGDGVSQAEIGRRVRLANYAITRNLDTLAARGLVDRQPDATSRRAHRVVLTGAGRALMASLFDAVAETNAAFMAPLSREERNTFLATLTKLVAAHGPADGGG